MMLKHLLLSPILLAGVIRAQDGADDSCDGDDCRGGADLNGVNNVVNMVRTMICRVFHPTKSLRKCGARDQEVEDALRNYGCNCLPSNFDDEPTTDGGLHDSWHMGKNGRPISEVDAACTRLRDAYTCIVIDTDDSVMTHPDAASPDNQDYCGRFTTYEYHIDNDKEVICGPESDPEYASGATEDVCRKAACDLERQFAAEVFNLIGADPDVFAANNAASYNIHSDPTLCINTNNGHGVSECCGDFPLRYPFIPFIKTCCEVGGQSIPIPIGECDP